MGKTIIQTIGPLYGEVVNGTVFGRPNGSIYVPASNIIKLSNVTSKINNFVVGTGYRVRFVDGDGNAVVYKVSAESQDISSYMRIVLASDSDLKNVLGIQNFNAGIFNETPVNIVLNYELTAETTYYVGAVLVNNDVPVAVDVVEVVSA
jgi:hypothetical protein